MRTSDLNESNFEQSSRYEVVDGEWFFHSREGEVLGPYSNFEDAVEGVIVYISLMSLDEELKVA